MSYQEMNALYRGPDRNRYEMCVREQATIFSADTRVDIKTLGQKIVAGSISDIDSVIASICTGPNYNQLNEDAGLLSAVQAVWPTVAAARYPQE